LITWFSLYIFIDPPLESLHWFLRQLTDYDARFNFGLEGLSASAGAWNAVRLGGWAVSALFGQAAWPLPMTELVVLHRLYFAAMALLGAFLAFHVLLVERRFARRAILLLLYITFSVPGGGAYKLMHVVTALVILILIPQRRRFDLLAVATLAFAIIPKQEIIWTRFGASDSLAPDVSIAVILNPLALLVATGLLVAGGYARSLALRARWRKLLAVFRLAPARSATLSGPDGTVFPAK
jgi:hypothetical protein